MTILMVSMPTTSESSEPEIDGSRPTQPDGGRHPEPSWTSLTRKRSLVQIQYGPPVLTWHFGLLRPW